MEKSYQVVAKLTMAIRKQGKIKQKSMKPQSDSTDVHFLLPGLLALSSHHRLLLLPPWARGLWSGKWPNGTGRNLTDTKEAGDLPKPGMGASG